MIRTIPIPKTVGRMGGGCSPGGGCCDECGTHKTGALTGVSQRISTPGEGSRNSSLKGVLGDTACDSDGNCYDTGTGALLAAPLTTGTGCPPGVQSCSSNSIGAAVGLPGLTNLSLLMLAGTVLIGLMASSGGKRR